MLKTLVTKTLFNLISLNESYNFISQGSTHLMPENFGIRFEILVDMLIHHLDLILLAIHSNP